MKEKTLHCVHCKQIKPYDQFTNDRTRVTGKFPWCKPCVIKSRNETKKRDKDLDLPFAQEGERRCSGCLKSIEGMHSNRIYCSSSCKDRVRRWKVFGLSPDEYRLIIASNNGKCPICLRITNRWVLDHNHETGEVTGAICSICNQSLIAYTRHDVEITKRLQKYLKEYPLPKILGESRYVGPESLAQMDRIKGWRAQRGYDVGLAHAQR